MPDSLPPDLAASLALRLDLIDSYATEADQMDRARLRLLAMAQHGCKFGCGDAEVAFLLAQNATGRLTLGGERLAPGFIAYLTMTEAGYAAWEAANRPVRGLDDDCGDGRAMAA